jgi:polysaccharide deacetylase 2 family uncharacterized protein YibQ
MPRTRSKRKQSSASATPSRAFKILIAVFVGVALAGTAAVRFLQTTRGGAFLVDHSVESAYPRVQSDIGVALKRALEASGLRKHIRVGGDAAHTPAPAVWDIPCDESTDLLLVNAALTGAVRHLGVRVRRAEQIDHGRTLLFDVGTATRDTHRLTIRRLAPRIAAAALGSAPRLPRVAIVIDDFGYSAGGVPGEVIDLPMPLTVSILPELRFSQAVYAAARKRHRCVLLHLPMEATERYPEDIQPVTVEMSDAEIRSVVGEYIESLPRVDGVNNHQGSLATADTRVMRAVCAALKPYHVFFLDSLTSPKSVAYNVAVSEGMRAASNSLFLDDATEESEVVEERIRELIRLAQKNGSAIGIGHPHPWTLEALRATADEFDRADVELVTVCDLILDAAPSGTNPQETQ